MDRSLFPSNVEIDQPDLLHSQDQLITHLLRRTKLVGQMGLTSGGAVTAGASNGTVNVAAFEGHTFGGEFIEKTTSTSGVALADSSADAVNYVVAVYTETSGEVRAHASENTGQATRATRSVRVKCLTQAQLNALVATTYTNPTATTSFTAGDLTIDALDRVMVLRRVVGRGAAVLNAADIGAAFPTITSRVLSVTQPTLISGVEIKSISATGTPQGEGTLTLDQTGPTGQLGTLRFVCDGTFGNSTFQYKAPGAGSFGTAGGEPSAALSTLTGPSGTLTVKSSGSTQTLTVFVEKRLLPTTAGNHDDATINVSALYEPKGGAPATAQDQRLRHLTGSSIPTATNPLGLGLEDLAPVLGKIPRTLDLGTSLTGSEANALIPRLLATWSSSSDPWTLFAQTNDDGGAGTCRMYIGVGGLIRLTWNALYDTGSNWNADTTLFDAFALQISPSAGFQLYTFPASTPDSQWATSEWMELGAADITGTTATNGLIHLASGFVSTAANAGLARIVSRYSTASGARTLLFESPDSSGGGLYVMRMYRTESGVMELTFNAKWNSGTSQWDRSNSWCAKVVYGDEPATGTPVVRFYFVSSGSSSFANGSWTQRFEVNLSSGAITIGGNFTVPGNLVVSGTATVTGQITGSGGLNISGGVIVASGNLSVSAGGLQASTTITLPLGSTNGVQTWSGHGFVCAHGRWALGASAPGGFAGGYGLTATPASLQDSNRSILITLDTSMGGTQYQVYPSFAIPSFPGDVANVLPLGDAPFEPIWFPVSATQFKLMLVDDANDLITLNDALLNSYSIAAMVIGRVI